MEGRRFKLILYERKTTADIGEFEGKVYLSTPAGGVIKEVRVPVCDWCGGENDNFSVCVGCGRKLCKSCSVVYRARIYCPECLSSILPLSKREFKVLIALAEEIRDCNTIAELARMSKDDVKSCIEGLAEKGLIDIRGFLVFKRVTVLDRGLEAISVYRQIYDRDGDVAAFQASLEAMLNEREG